MLQLPALMAKILSFADPGAQVPGCTEAMMHAAGYTNSLADTVASSEQQWVDKGRTQEL